MLEIIGRLFPFFEDCCREISVREYGREVSLSPATASKLLNSFVREGYLERREMRGFLLFKADEGSLVMRDLSRIHWRVRLRGVLDSLDFDSVVLFGVLTKLKVVRDSVVELAVFGGSGKAVDLGKFEKVLGRKVRVSRFKSFGSVPKELRLNIVNGCILRGCLK